MRDKARPHAPAKPRRRAREAHHEARRLGTRGTVSKTPGVEGVRAAFVQWGASATMSNRRTSIGLKIA